MRIWSIHPSYLDSKGLVALWRETLLARKVLQGKTKGYSHHPQLDRFRKSADPVSMIDAYLTVVAEEADKRGYSFDHSKFQSTIIKASISVTEGQLEYETFWLKQKLAQRDPERLLKNGNDLCYTPHPVFTIIKGEIEPWEKAEREKKQS